MAVSFNNIFCNKNHWKSPFIHKPIENQRTYELTTKEKVVTLALTVFSLPFFIGTFYLMTAYFKYRALKQIQINKKSKPENSIISQSKLVIQQQHHQKAIDPLLSVKLELPSEQLQPKVLGPIFQPKSERSLEQPQLKALDFILPHSQLELPSEQLQPKVLGPIFQPKPEPSLEQPQLKALDDFILPKPERPLEQPQTKVLDPILSFQPGLPLAQPQPKVLDSILPQNKLELSFETPSQMQTLYQPGLNLVASCPTFRNTIQLSIGFPRHLDLKTFWFNTRCSCCDKQFDDIPQPEKAIVLNDCQYSYHAFNVQTGERVNVPNCITREPIKICCRPENFRYIVFKLDFLPENI